MYIYIHIYIYTYRVNPSFIAPFIFIFDVTDATPTEATQRARRAVEG